MIVARLLIVQGEFYESSVVDQTPVSLSLVCTQHFLSFSPSSALPLILREVATEKRLLSGSLGGDHGGFPLRGRDKCSWDLLLVNSTN